MDHNRKKELLDAYKNRRPEMGVISFYCKATGETFLGTSSDTRADLNSHRFKLSTGTHPNKHLVELWRQHGEQGFECTVLKILKYEDPLKDHSDELEKLRETCFAANPEASKLWR